MDLDLDLDVDVNAVERGYQISGLVFGEWPAFSERWG